MKLEAVDESETIASTPLASFPAQADAAATQFQRWLFGLYLLFVIYGSLVPLHFVPRSLWGALDDLGALGQAPLDFSSRSDWATNLVLFIPLTFLAGQAFLGRCRGVGKLGLMALFAVLASALAVVIELAQMFFPTRTPSENDIVALSISGVVGLVVQGVAGARVQGWLAGYWHTGLVRDKLARVLLGYLFVLFLFAVMPLDLTLSVAELFRKWRDGRVIFVPFGGWHGPVEQMLYQSLTDVLIWVPAGALWALQSKATVWRVARRGGAMALLLEFL